MVTETVILNGKPIADEIKAQLRPVLSGLDFQPLLVDIMVGPDAVTATYVHYKQKAAVALGLLFDEVVLPHNITLEEIQEVIMQQNKRENICGLIVQLPLPSHLQKHQAQILNCINPSVDVDVLTDINLDAFYAGRGFFEPTTAAAVMCMLASAGEQYTGTKLRGKKIAVVGQGMLVGKPVTHMLRRLGARVSVADKETSSETFQKICREADVIISATGSPGLITADLVNENAVVIDAGTSEVGGQIVGDVDQESVKDKVRALTPTKGGVGPVTVAMLLYNVVQAAKRK